MSWKIWSSESHWQSDVDEGVKEALRTDERREPVELRRRTRVLEKCGEEQEACLFDLIDKGGM